MHWKRVVSALFSVCDRILYGIISPRLEIWGIESGMRVFYRVMGRKALMPKGFHCLVLRKQQHSLMPLIPGFDVRLFIPNSWPLAFSFCCSLRDCLRPSSCYHRWWDAVGMDSSSSLKDFVPPNLSGNIELSPFKWALGKLHGSWGTPLSPVFVEALATSARSSKAFEGWAVRHCKFLVLSSRGNLFHRVLYL